MMRLVFLVCMLLACGSANRALAQSADPAPVDSLNADLKYSLNTGSFVYHAYSPQRDFTQYFENHFFALERKIRNPYVDALVIGSALNSHGNRCLMLGVQKDWIQYDERLSFEGVYAYAGEFFFDAFDRCGDEGFYSNIKDITGVGFTMYIYHGIEYDLGRHLSLEFGAALPAILLLSVQWHF